jgi:long-chain fatty acid transport protein
MFKVKFIRLAVFLCCLGASVLAAAGGPYPTKSGIAASAADAGVAGNNPAAMTRFDDWSLRVGVFGFFSDSTFEGAASGTGQTFISESDGTTIIPSASYVLPFKEKWWFGFTVLGVGFSDDFGEDWAGRYVIQDYSLAYISAYPSIATKITDKLSLAASLMLTYTVFEQNKAVLNLDPGFDDGSLNLEADGWTAGFSFSMLYEFNDHTRLGAVYRSELDPDLDGDLNFSGLSPMTEAALDAAGLFDATASVSSRSPQSFNLGIHHDFANTHSLAVDLIWIQFSEFELSEIYINGNALVETNPTYEDIMGLSIAYNFPISDRVRLGVGAFLTDEMIKDENRTMMLRLDQATSYGVGVEWLSKGGRTFSLNLNYLDFGDAPVTSPDLPVLGVISGEYTTRDTYYLEFSAAFGAKPRQ